MVSKIDVNPTSDKTGIHLILPYISTHPRKKIYDWGC